jgi:hypothetical protein
MKRGAKEARGGKKGFICTMEDVARNYLQTQHNNLKSEFQAYAQKLAEMEGERKEHR